MNDVTYEETWIDDNVCYGHNPTDIQPFHDMFLGEEDDSSATDESTVDDRGGIAPIKKYYTNEMMYHLLAPDGMNTPYVYDNFEWSHCDVSCFKSGDKVRLFARNASLCPGRGTTHPSWSAIMTRPDVQ